MSILQWIRFPCRLYKHSGPGERLSIVKKKQVCFNCFGNHKVADCRSRYKCRKCNKNHHTSLCDKKSQSKSTHVNSTAIEDNNATQNVENGTSILQTSSSVFRPQNEVLLKTAILSVWYANPCATANILLVPKTFQTSGQRKNIKENKSSKQWTLKIKQKVTQSD